MHVLRSQGPKSLDQVCIWISLSSRKIALSVCQFDPAYLYSHIYSDDMREDRILVGAINSLSLIFSPLLFLTRYLTPISAALFSRDYPFMASLVQDTLELCGDNIFHICASLPMHAYPLGVAVALYRANFCATAITYMTFLAHSHCSCRRNHYFAYQLFIISNHDLI